MEADKNATDWTNVLASIIKKIQIKKQRPSMEKICLSVRKQKTGLSNDFITSRLKDAVLQGKLVKLVKNGQASYDVVTNQHRPRSEQVAVDKDVGYKSTKSKNEGLSVNKPSLPDTKSSLMKDHSSKISEFSLLDVVWAQMSGYPSWPAMVRTSPENIFKRENKIHVQFFGDLSRAWVTKNKIKMFIPAKNKEKQSKTKLKSNKALVESIAEATEVYNLPLDEREGYLIPMKVDKLEVVPKDRQVDAGMIDVDKDSDDQNVEEDICKKDSVISENHLPETVTVLIDKTKDIHGSMEETNEDILIGDMYCVVPGKENVSKVFVDGEVDAGKSSFNHFSSLKDNIGKLSTIRKNLESPIVTRDIDVSQSPTSSALDVESPIVTRDKHVSQSPTSSALDVESPFSPGCQSTPSSSKDFQNNGYSSQDHCTPQNSQTSQKDPQCSGQNSPYSSVSKLDSPHTDISQQNSPYSDISKQDSPYSQVSRKTHQDSPFLETAQWSSPSFQQKSPPYEAGTAVEDFKRWMEISYPPLKEGNNNNDNLEEESSNYQIYEEPVKKTSKGHAKRKKDHNSSGLHSNKDGTNRIGYPTSTPSKHVAPGIKRIKLATGPRLQPIQQGSLLDGSPSAVLGEKVQIPVPNEHSTKGLPEVINVSGESEEDLNNHLESISGAMDLPKNVSDELANLSQNAEGASPKFKVELTVTSKQLLGLKLLGFI